MLTKTIAYSLLICDNCNKFIIYNPASQGFPNVCPKCGVPSNRSLTTEEMTILREQQEKQQQRQQQPFGHSFTIRRG